MWALRQLLVPCNYLRISQGPSLLASKAVYDWIIPTILALLTLAILYGLDIPLEVSSYSGLAASLSSLLALLIAFYMAALAAVATFGRPEIDKPLRGGDAVLKVLNHNTGKREPKALTYRQFISYLFGYLSFLSLLLFLLLMVFGALWPRLAEKAAAHAVARVVVTAIEPVLFVMFTFGVWQMLIASLVGIYFLTDRIHTINDHHH